MLPLKKLSFIRSKMSSLLGPLQSKYYVQCPQKILADFVFEDLQGISTQIFQGFLMDF